MNMVKRKNRVSSFDSLRRYGPVPVLQFFLTSARDHFQYPDMKFFFKSGVIDLLRPLRPHAQKDACSKMTIPP